MPSQEDKCRKSMTHIRIKYLLMLATSSEEHDRTEYYRDYYGNLKLILCYPLTSCTTKPLRKAIQLLHGPRLITIRPLRRAILKLWHSPRHVIIWTLRRARLNLLHAGSKAYYHMDSEKSRIEYTAWFKPCYYTNLS